MGNDNYPALAPEPEEVLEELKFENYLPEGPELREIKTNARLAIETMIREPANYRCHIEKAREFLRALWNKYDCENILEVFDAFMKVEPVLINMQGDDGVGVGYRDHFVHTFHVFTFGLRFISKLISNVGDKKAQEMLKVKPERISQFIPSFRDYNFKERLFYLWCLVSTFHDIAVPLEHLHIIRNGLGEFSQKFDLNIVGPSLQRDILISDIDTYFSLLSRIFQGRESPDDEGLRYKQDEENHYVKKTLIRKFAINDHGVLGGFMMYKTIEKTFLLGLSKKHKFDKVELFNNYVTYILTQDIARAALAISLHNLKGTPQDEILFLPLHFEGHPLTFILILSDGIQEYLRWEGSSLRGGTKIDCFPRIELKTSSDKPKLELEVTYYLDKQIDEFFIRRAKFLAKKLGVNEPKNLTEAVSILCNALSKELTKQIYLNGNFALRLAFVQEGQMLFMQKIEG